MKKVIKSPKDEINSSNTTQFIKSLARFTLTGIISFGIGTIASFDRYNNYWNKTIFRVQTVDFNILSHTLPTKLSYAIAQNQPQELQRTLDSNYNLFGLIVTDSSGQKIMAFSGKNSPRYSSWKNALNPQELKNHPYDLLLDPPPVFSQWTYSNSHATDRTATNFTNTGRVIGRVYYVRGVRPTFAEDFLKWLSNPLSGSSNFETYTMTLLISFTGGLAVLIFLEYILYKKRSELEIANKREQELEDNNKVLEIQLAQRIDELTLLQNQIKVEKNELTKDANNLRVLNKKLNQEIDKLKESLNSLSKNAQDLLPLQAELERTRLEAQENLDKQKQYQQHIEKLNQDLQIAQKKQLEANELYKLKENELAQLQKQIQNIENSRSLAKLELEQLRNNEIRSQKIAIALEQQLNNQQLEQQQLHNELRILQSSLLESRQRAQQVQAESQKTKQDTQENLNQQKQYQQHIEKLTQDLQIAQKKQLENYEPKENELAQLQQYIQKIENSRYLAQRQLEQLRNNEIRSQEIATTLEQQLTNQKLEQQQLHNKLEILRSSLLESQQLAQQAQAESEKTKLDAQENLNKQQEYEEQIKILTQNLQIAQKKQIENNELKKNELTQLQQQIQKIENSRSLVKSELQQLRNNEVNSQKIITALEQQLANQVLVQEQLNDQLEILQNSLLESQEREQKLEQLAQNAQSKLEVLNEEITRIKEDEGRHDLNRFEVSIKNCLERYLSEERVLTQFDVGSGKQGSKFTDFIIITNKCCIVIEAKSYKGIIKSIGNPRNTGWTCDRGNTKLYIYACWGENPYQQVKNYANYLYRYINSSNKKKFPVYGVVVFPTNSNIDNNITSNISGFYRVTTLNNLIPVIEELDHQAGLQNVQTHQKILQILNGISNQQQAA